MLASRCTLGTMLNSSSLSASTQNALFDPCHSLQSRTMAPSICSVHGIETSSPQRRAIMHAHHASTAGKEPLRKQGLLITIQTRTKQAGESIGIGPAVRLQPNCSADGANQRLVERARKTGAICSEERRRYVCVGQRHVPKIDGRPHRPPPAAVAAQLFV